MTNRGPTVVIAACIVRGDEVLLSQRNQPSVPGAHLRWELPGGKIEFTESPEDALRREIFEELGTGVHVVRLLPHVQSNIYERDGGDAIHSVVMAYECVIASGDPRPSPAETAVARVRWYPRDALPDDLLPGTEAFVSCLARLDRATSETTRMYVRLERRGPKGLNTWLIHTVEDLWGQTTLVERHVNEHSRSTHSAVRELDPQQTARQLVAERVHALSRRGYRVSSSSDPAWLPLGRKVSG